MADLLQDIFYGEIILPDEIHVAADREMNLWWSTAAVYEEGDRSIYFEVKCDVGITTARGFTLNAKRQMIGDHTLTIRSRELHTRRILSEKTVAVHIVDPYTGEGKKNILFIGDSRSVQSSNGPQGYRIREQGNETTTVETKRLLDMSKGATFNFIGTRPAEFDRSVRNLANNGWTYLSAIETIENAGGIIPYVENECGCGKDAALDYAVIQYGANDIADWHENNLDQYEKSVAKIDGVIENAKKLVDMLLEGYPECRIIIVLEASNCANQDGFAYWGATDNDCMVEQEFALKAFRKKNIEVFDNGAYSKNVTLSTAGLWCDRLYGYPYVMAPASVRSLESRVLRLTNCVHPHDNGYKQIADGDFSTIKYLESK